ncbi:Beta-galactosidase BglY [compost metagenome]
MVQPFGKGAGALRGSYVCNKLCDLLHLEGAETLLVYDEDFYAGRPAVTRNTFGRGQAYYIASHFEARFYDDFYLDLTESVGLYRPVDITLPDGVYAAARSDEKVEYIFLQNYNAASSAILPLGSDWQAVSREADLSQPWALAPYEVLVAKRTVQA